MCLRFPVYFNNQPIGEIVLQKEGLYYKYRCNCDLVRNDMHKVLMIAENKLVNLGICIPAEGGFETHGRIPVNQITQENLAFCAVPHKTLCRYTTVDVEKPFLDIEHLESGNMTFVNKHAIMIVCP